MAGYGYKQGIKYTPEQLERIRRLQQLADEALTIRERTLLAEKRMADLALADTLAREQTLSEGSAAAKELARIQREHPQPPGIGAKRMAQLLREIEAASVERRVKNMRPASYDIAA